MFTTLLTTTALLLPFTSAAGGLYTKASPVLQLDARSYDRLIAKSNYTSMVEFYAPWCGHCQNLKPAYEKAATALDGIARVAAVNCDEEENKTFCGSMDVKGFPTLKIVKPVKSRDGKKSRPMVEDYQGERTAKAIHEALSDKVTNHVTRLKDAGVAAWLEAGPTKPKAIFFSEKGTVGPLIKAVAIDFLGSVDVAFVRSTEKETVQKYAVNTFPTVVLLPGEEKEPVPYSGEMKKTALIDFLTQVASPNPDADPAKFMQSKPKPNSSKKPKASSSAKAAKTSTADKSSMASSAAAEATTNVASPPHAPVQPAAQILSLSSENDLQKSCIHTKSGTCVLAIVPQDLVADVNSDTAISALNEIAHKHKSRGKSIFPFYVVPSVENALAQKLTSLLLEQSPATAGAIDLIALNAKKGWWTRYTGNAHTQSAIEDWIDNIRFGELSKSLLPEGLVQEIQQEEAPKVEKKAPVVEDEPPIELKFENMDGASGDLGNGLRYEWVEVDEDYVPEQPTMEESKPVERDEL
jgi:protein disulfide-isomerase A6